MDNQKSNYDLTILSLGAGVQSTALALMVEKGYLDYDIDYAIFADTGAEPVFVYKHLEWLINEIQSFDILMVSNGSLEKDLIDAGEGSGRFASIPFHATNKDGKSSMLRRQCTREYKVEPIYKKIRDLLGLKPYQKNKKQVQLLMGISYDEALRMKENHVKWITNSFPLVRNQIRRYDCLKWLEENGYPEPPKSSCYFCPYHDDNYWKELKENHPRIFQRAVKIDENLRTAGYKKFDSELYLHRERKPLKDIDFDKNKNQMDLFNDECEGMCGL